jgi:hypothetical protein
MTYNNFTEQERLEIAEDFSPSIWIIVAWVNLAYQLIYLLFCAIHAAVQADVVGATMKNYAAMFLSLGF